MSVSTWNNTYQHWLSQFLLKGFGKKRNARKIFQRDCIDGSITTVKVRDVASRPWLVSDQDDAVQRKIEGRVAQIIDEVRRHRLGNITEEHRADLDRLVMALVFNHPSFHPHKESIRREVV